MERIVPNAEVEMSFWATVPHGNIEQKHDKMLNSHFFLKNI